MYLATALRLALRHMSKWTWYQCCHTAILSLTKPTGVPFIKNPETIMDWNTILRATPPYCFQNHAKYHRDKVPLLPPILSNNPYLKESLVSYCNEKLNDLSAELVTSYLFDTALPALVKKRREELNDETYSITDVLTENRLTKLCLGTVYNWMAKLGFKYETRKKCYYVDGHETPHTQA